MPWGGRAAADQGPVCWILDFSWPSLHTIHIRYSWSDVCSVPNCAKNRLALYFAERSSYVSRCVCVLCYSTFET